VRAAGGAAAYALQRRIGFACLAIAAGGWGLNWPAIKLISPEAPPMLARGAAAFAAALLLAGFALAKGESLRVPRPEYAALAWASFTNVFAWMGFSALSILWLRVSEGALLVYTMPIWASVLSWILLGSRPTSRAFIALALGVSGVVLLLAGDGASFGVDKAPGIAFALAAAMLFALGAVTSREPLGLPPIAGTAWQLALGSLPLLLVSWLAEPAVAGPLSAQAWAAWAYMTIVPMAICYLAWFAAVRRLSPATAATGMLASPLIGALAAAPLVGDAVGSRDFVALLLTLSGVALAMRKVPERARPPALDTAAAVKAAASP
jgi:drug/metabolite transporter (DMT)-like permease